MDMCLLQKKQWPVAFWDILAFLRQSERFVPDEIDINVIVDI
jgi:hypothetical protein